MSNGHKPTGEHEASASEGHAMHGSPHTRKRFATRAVIISAAVFAASLVAVALAVWANAEERHLIGTWYGVDTDVPKSVVCMRFFAGGSGDCVHRDGTTYHLAWSVSDGTFRYRGWPFGVSRWRRYGERFAGDISGNGCSEVAMSRRPDGAVELANGVVFFRDRADAVAVVARSGTTRHPDADLPEGQEPYR